MFNKTKNGYEFFGEVNGEYYYFEDNLSYFDIYDQIYPDQEYMMQDENYRKLVNRLYEDMEEKFNYYEEHESEKLKPIKVMSKQEAEALDKGIIHYYLLGDERMLPEKFRDAFLLKEELNREDAGIYGVDVMEYESQYRLNRLLRNYVKPYCKYCA